MGLAARRSRQREHALLMCHGRIGTKEDSFHPAEHRGVRANSESEAQNRQGGEPGVAPQLPKAAAQILEEVFDDVDAARLAALLFDLGDSAQGAARRVARLLRRHAFREVFPDLQLEMVAKLVSQFLVHPRAAEE